MYEFEYSRATSLDDAASRLGSDEEARLVAGGMTLLPTLKLRLAKPTSADRPRRNPGTEGHHAKKATRS